MESSTTSGSELQRTVSSDGNNDQEQFTNLTTEGARDQVAHSIYNKGKRRRRSAKEVHRKFECNFPGCNRAYGARQALRHHVSQKHTQSMSPLHISQPQPRQPQPQPRQPQLQNQVLSQPQSQPQLQPQSQPQPQPQQSMRTPIYTPQMFEDDLKRHFSDSDPELEFKKRHSKLYAGLDP